MPPTYQQNKKHIYKWREQNREQRNNYEARSKRCRIAKKEFLNIILII